MIFAACYIISCLWPKCPWCVSPQYQVAQTALNVHVTVRESVSAHRDLLNHIILFSFTSKCMICIVSLHRKLLYTSCWKIPMDTCTYGGRPCTYIVAWKTQGDLADDLYLSYCMILCISTYMCVTDCLTPHLPVHLFTFNISCTACQFFLLCSCLTCTYLNSYGDLELLIQAVTWYIGISQGILGLYISLYIQTEVMQPEWGGGVSKYPRPVSPCECSNLISCKVECDITYVY